MTNRERMRKALAGRSAKGEAPPEAPPQPEATPPVAEAPAPPKGKPLRAERLDNKQVARGRLPDGSEFQARYDARARRWAGTLRVSVNGEAKVFEESASGVWSLMGKLDARYREWLHPTPEAPANPSPQEVPL